MGAQALRINDRGQILLSGPYQGWDTEYRVLWDGKVQRTWHEADGFLPDAINNLGEMAGRTKGGSRVAFLERDGKVVPINVPNEGGFPPQACCLNDRGQVAGTFVNNATHITSSVFIWQDGKLRTVIADTSFGAAGSRTSHNPGAINEKGEVAGTFGLWEAGSGHPISHLFVWESMGIVDRGVLGFQGMAHGINNKGMIVGEGNWPFLTSGSEMLNLNSFLPPNFGWTMHEAVGINDRTQIVGNGKLHGKDRALLMTPDP